MVAGKPKGYSIAQVAVATIINIKDTSDKYSFPADNHLLGVYEMSPSVNNNVPPTKRGGGFPITIDGDGFPQGRCGR